MSFKVKVWVRLLGLGLRYGLGFRVYGLGMGLFSQGLETHVEGSGLWVCRCFMGFRI